MIDLTMPRGILGLPRLREMAKQDGADAVQHLEQLYRDALRWIPTGNRQVAL